MFARHVVNSIVIMSLVFGQTIASAASANPKAQERLTFFNDINTSESGRPSDLKYFKYYDSMPPEISMEAFDGIDLSKHKGKSLFVGYGTADVRGDDCKMFPLPDGDFKEVCMPWWRIERTYKLEKDDVENAVAEFLKTYPKPRPPLSVSVCNEWKDEPVYSGGEVTCTSYFSRTAGDGCYQQPMQQKCYVDNCTEYVKNECSFKDAVNGDVMELQTPISKDGTTKAEDTKIMLTTHQYVCPSGPMVENATCLDEERAFMFPFECKSDDPDTPEDDGIYKYCDKSKPVYSQDGVIQGFRGTCPAESDHPGNVICEADTLKETKTICTDPVYDQIETSFAKEQSYKRSYTLETNYDEVDEYMAKPECIRNNTAEDSRDVKTYSDIVANGYLDDDIYILKHEPGGSFNKIYCNQQHNENAGSKKLHQGVWLNCIDNDGHYSMDFSGTDAVEVEPETILTIQQATENENNTGQPFAIGRRHYSSTNVMVDGVTAAPAISHTQYPHYPDSNGKHLKTWDNTSTTFTVMFPFTGDYELYFYNKNNDLLTTQTITFSDFALMETSKSFKRLKLAEKIGLADGVDEESACLDDDMVEIGGGVHGGKASKTGKNCDKPDDEHVKENAITNIIVKDLVTGSVIPVELIYPLPFPNNIFVSKLNVYEKREYRCYEPFKPLDPPVDGSHVYKVCSTDPEWIDYQNGDHEAQFMHWPTDKICQQNCFEQLSCNKNPEGEFICEDSNATSQSFDDETQCQLACRLYPGCDTYTEGACELTQEEVGKPLTDFTGKTLYTQKDVAWACSEKDYKQVDCLNYETVSNESDLTSGLPEVGYESKNFKNQFENAVSHLSSVEQMMHIWSGWHGYCEYGYKTDTESLTSPSAIVGYVMGAYSAYQSAYGAGAGESGGLGEGAEGGGDAASAGQTVGDASNAGGAVAENMSAWDKLGQAYEDVRSSISSMIENTTKPLKEIAKTAKDTFSNVGDATGVTKATAVVKDGVTGAGDWFQDVTGFENHIYTFKEAGVITPGSIELMWSDVALVAVEAMVPSEDEYDQAAKMLNAYYGGDPVDDSSLAYVQCMSSIGMSMPNLMSYSMSSEDAPSELKKPYEHPLRLNKQNLADIVQATSEKYARNAYEIMDVDDSGYYTVIAADQRAFQQAGQAVCSNGQISQAMNIQNNKTNENVAESPSTGEAVAEAAAKMAVKKMLYSLGPWGFVASVVLDFVMATKKGNACTSIEDARMWGATQEKTNKFMNHGQCHYVEGECVKEWFWGSCKLHRKDYCCYDQISTRIFAESMKMQLGKPWKKKGSYQCNDLTVMDLKNVSFEKCGRGENPKADKCISRGKYREFTNAMMKQSRRGIDMGEIADHVENVMAVPH